MSSSQRGRVHARVTNLGFVLLLLCSTCTGISDVLSPLPAHDRAATSPPPELLPRWLDDDDGGGGGGGGGAGGMSRGTSACAAGLECTLHKRDTAGKDFPAAIRLRCHTSVDRRVPASSPWRRVLRGIKLLDLTRYFRDQTKTSIRTHARRFEALMRHVSSQQAQQGPRSRSEARAGPAHSEESDRDLLQELSLLVRGLLCCI